MTPAEPKWLLLGGRTIQKALEAESPEMLDALQAAMNEFMLDPEAYAGTRLAKRPIAGNFRNMHLVKLPGGWWLTCEIHPDGMPPLGGPIVLARALVRVWPDDPEQPIETQS
jgi:hypothetical protein